MDRRAFIRSLTLGLLAAPRAAEAQQPKKLWRIGFLAVSTRTSAPHYTEAFLLGLRDLGYVEGRNILIEWRYAEGKAERLPELAAELVRLKVDIMVAVGTAVTQAAKDATTTIPIVGVSMADPVELRFVASLARPGGTITGLSFAGREIAAKNLQLLTEAVPGASRIAVLWNLRTVLLALAATLVLSGCATTIQEDPGRDRWQFDLMACGQENRAFLLIPDGGITFEIRRGKCMRARHWARSGEFTWTWTGGPPPPATHRP